VRRRCTIDCFKTHVAPLENSYNREITKKNPGKGGIKHAPAARARGRQGTTPPHRHPDWERLRVTACRFCWWRGGQPLLSLQDRLDFAKSRPDQTGKVDACQTESPNYHCWTMIGSSMGPSSHSHGVLTVGWASSSADTRSA
jgi:hypothetical protein